MGDDVNAGMQNHIAMILCLADLVIFPTTRLDSARPRGVEPCCREDGFSQPLIH